MAFLLTLFQLVQPGILFPSLQEFKPVLVLSVLALIVALASRPLVVQLGALRHSTFVALLFFVLAQGASVHYSGVSSVLETLASWSIYPAFVALGVLLIAKVRDLRGFVWGTILGSAWVTSYGLYGAFSETRLAKDVGAYGMYQNHNDFTYPIILAIPFIYLLRRSEERAGIRLLLLALLGIAVLGIFLSLSRGGILALVLEMALLVTQTRQSIKKVAALAVLGLLATVAVEYLWARRAEVQADYTAEDAERSRFELWKVGKEMFLAHPLLGVGSERFTEFNRQYGELSHDYWGKGPHNTYIEVLACSGLAGFVPFMVFLVASLRELRVPAVPFEDPTYGAIRNGARISLYAIIFRAFTNAKSHDWSFYILAVIAISCASLREQASWEEEEEEEGLYPQSRDAASLVERHS